MLFFFKFTIIKLTLTQQSIARNNEIMHSHSLSFGDAPHGVHGAAQWMSGKWKGRKPCNRTSSAQSAGLPMAMGAQREAVKAERRRESRRSGTEENHFRTTTTTFRCHFKFADSRTSFRSKIHRPARLSTDSVGGRSIG